MTAPVSIRGVGTSRFARQPETPPTHLAWQAVTEALADAGVTPAAVEAVYAGTVFGDPGVTTRTLQHLGITGVPVVTVENACASGTTAFHEAHVAVGQGRYETVLAFGIETMTAVFDGPIEPLLSDPEGAQGFAMPSLYGMAAHRYQHCYGVTPEQMALVAVKNRRHALGNPRAQHAGEFTVEQILDSRPISDPLTLLQCCDISDAAAAAVLGPPRPAGGTGGDSDVPVRASALASGQAWDHTSDLVWGWQLVSDTGRAAFEQAGIGPEDIDVLEVHDAFTIGEIVTTEALGLCELGGGGALVASGRTSLGGAQPVNPSGGLLARGHPLGATGLGQIAEIVWQLRGMAEGRQVEGARIGVVETMGGGTAGIDGNACVVAVLEAPGEPR
ncbi:MAG: thiolase family protein [Acidimicrobiia bacterium]|nr:thiolase family protein [Acidimicrobiia bacterium]MYC46099.1 thiolase family protein [Acidimicrobiia bacterium]MYI19282.1 thiolase family protein [Acidimicrobiia bacterium]